MNSASDLSITWPRPAQGQTVFLVKKLFFSWNLFSTYHPSINLFFVLHGSVPGLIEIYVNKRAV